LERRRRLSESPPVLPSYIALVSISLGLYFLAHYGEEVGPLFRFVEGHAAEADDVAVMAVGWAGVHLLAADVGEDAFAVSGVLADERVSLLGSEGEPHSEDDGTLEAQGRIRPKLCGIVSFRLA